MPDTDRSTASKLAQATIAGFLCACLLAPPLVGFYWGWAKYAGQSHPEWPPVVGALAQGFMGHVIYWYMMMEDGPFSSTQATSFVAVFLFLFALASYCLFRKLNHA